MSEKLLPEETTLKLPVVHKKSMPLVSTESQVISEELNGEQAATQKVAITSDTLSTASSPQTPVAPFSKKMSARRKNLRLRTLLVCLAVVLILSSVSGGVLYLIYAPLYEHDKQIAQQGVQHLQAAQTLLKNIQQGRLPDKQAIQHTRSELVQAHTNFQQLQRDINALPQFIDNTPHYGSMLSAARHLLPIAINTSKAGITGCDLLGIVLPLLKNPLDTGGEKLVNADVKRLQTTFSELKLLLKTLVQQVGGLQPADTQIDARLGPMVKAFRPYQTAVLTGLEDAQVLVNFASLLLGVEKPTSYLIQQLDSSELRPGGGFVGTYGQLTLAGGKISQFWIKDIYLLDLAYTATGKTIPFPSAYDWFPLARNSWSLRDSNLEADFPTNARVAQEIYHTEAGKADFQGVIAITPAFIQKALEITGPIYVPEYHETITSRNLIDRIHYYQLKVEWEGGSVPSPDGKSSLRKHFTAVLFQHFLEHMQHGFDTHAGDYIQMFINSLHMKDIQLYLNPEPVQKLLQKGHIDAAIQAPPRGDSLFAVDANIGGNKSNAFMSYTIRDTIAIDEQGNAKHHAQISYNWPYSDESRDNNYGTVTDNYWGYLRLYVPPGSTLQKHPELPGIETGQAFNRQSWSSPYEVHFGTTQTFSFEWLVPAAAQKKGSTWQYQILLQRQSGILRHVDLHIQLPACAKVVSQTGMQQQKGHSQELTLNQELTNDLALNVDYRCQ